MQYTNIQPPLCLRLDNRIVDHAVAKSLCRQEEANLVRVKTLDIYEIVKELLTSESLKILGFISVPCSSSSRYQTSATTTITNINIQKKRGGE